MLDELLVEAAEEMDRRGHGGRRFAARLFRSDNQTRDLTVETGLPSRDPAVVGRLFRERIDALADPIDPGFGFDLIRLAIPVLEPLAPEQLALEGGMLADEALAALVDRLSTRLGRNRVRRLAPRDTHIPEQAAFSFPAQDARASEAWPALETGEPPLRPLHLFDPPQPILVTAEVPEGPPRQFQWRQTHHVIARHEGPERIASQWWRLDRKPDAAGTLTRDYYRVEDARGRRFWIFRNGLFHTETNAALVSARTVCMSGFAELVAATNYSFLRGASHPSDMVVRAMELKLTGIGIADRNTVAGVVRAWDALNKSRETGLEICSRSNGSKIPMPN